MTYAPARLLDVRHYLKPLTGLSDESLGIVGDEEHDGGYHHGWDDRRIVDGVLRDYSWQESPRDWNHKTNAARGFDLGWFDRVVYGRRVTLIDFNLWLAKELEAGAPDTIDIRELIYTPDGTTVRRWDRLKKRTSGDNSHLKHSHLSYFADAEDRDKTAVFRRFFEGDDMVNAIEWTTGWITQQISEMRDEIVIPAHTESGYKGYRAPNQLAAELRAIRAAQTAPAPVDIAALAEALAPLLPQPPTAEQVADVLAARLKD